jgi:hypothetical protein
VAGVSWTDDFWLGYGVYECLDPCPVAGVGRGALGQGLWASSDACIRCLR